MSVHALRRRPIKLIALGAAGLSLAAAAAVLIPSANAAPAKATGQAASPSPSSQRSGSGSGASQQAISSPNWAGYALIGNPGDYTSVSSSWTQPAVTCAAKSTYAGFWVGLNGANTLAVEQTGTEAQCENGKPVYGAWYGVEPTSPRTTYSHTTVRPGDRITASVTYNRHAKTYTMMLEDRTQHWRRWTVRTGSSGSDNSSAEVIVEVPSISSTPNGPGQPGKLSDFHTIAFRGTTVNGKRMPDDATPIVMTRGTNVAAEPRPSHHGSFAVLWRRY